MKRGISLLFVFALAPLAMAQEEDRTAVVITEEQVMDVECVDLLDDLWFFQDAVPLEEGTADLRIGFHWVTASAPANRGDSDDDFRVVPSFYWGAYENLQLSLRVPIWVGEGGNVPGRAVTDGGFFGLGGTTEEIDGNYDAYVGALWRLANQEGYWPAFALSGDVRIPTCNSDGVDAELRLIMTNDYESGLRSHINIFGKSVNGDNDPELRDCQYGAIIGLDGPLSDDGTLRWVADYFHRSGLRNGSSNSNLLELGWEWLMTDENKLGMNVQIGLDDEDDTENFGAKIVYAFSLGEWP